MAAGSATRHTKPGPLLAAMSAMATPASSTLVTLARRVASAAHACRKSASANTRTDSAVKKCATWNKPTEAAASVAATAPARGVSRRAAVRPSKRIVSAPSTPATRRSAWSRSGIETVVAVVSVVNARVM